MSQDRSDLTPAPDLTRERRTGPFRTQRPIYVDLLPPCNHACPAGENIQAWLGAAQAGDFEAAWRILVADNPMPAVHGRVCYHPCEEAGRPASPPPTTSPASAMRSRSATPAPSPAA